MTIDLNADLAEGFPYDEDLLGLVTTANICCGAHAGSEMLARHTLELCRRRGVRPCAHPGYPDPENMGRISQPLETPRQEADLIQSLRRQASILKGAGCVKPHGALYHDASKSGPHAVLMISLLVRWKTNLVGFPIGMHRSIAKAAGCRFLSEGFVDRRYLVDGTLAPRSLPGAVLEDEREIREQACSLAGKVDTLCLHGDTPNCVEIARLVRSALKEKGWTVSAP